MTDDRLPDLRDALPRDDLMTLDQALADVARLRRLLLDAARHRCRAEQQAVSDGVVGVLYRRAVTLADRVWLDEEWARGCQARSVLSAMREAELEGERSAG